LDGREVIVGVRPHFLEVDMDNGPIMAEVKVVEPTGVETYVFCEFAGQELACQVARTKAPRIGDTIRLSLAEEGILLFDKKTEERIGRQ
jgi:multiple sugar transport system ATP-binding protein